MPRDARAYISDLLLACDRLERFTRGKTLADYLADEMLRSAVERQFEIVGEALAQIRQHHPALFVRVTDAPLIVTFRNRLIHGYASVLDEVVWKRLGATST